jgi:cytochrome c peroxidase
VTVRGPFRRGIVCLAFRAVLACGALLAASPVPTRSFPIHGDQTVLPSGTELDEDSLDKPREIFHSEADGGGKSYLVNLGDLAFSSPGLLGGVARRAGMSCATCHLNGASNAKLYVPGLSTRPGNFDTTSALFNPKADNGHLDPVTIPSLRGVRYLAPYGHDGRMASLRDFIRNVIVNEFAGPEPGPAILDAMVAYLFDIDFLPNPRLRPGGRLEAGASDAERRGQVLFGKPFPHDPNLSCAACHVPSAAFVDHRQHDVGSGGLFKTKTLLNADFNAPYFHDGRYRTFGEVVAHFDRVYGLGLSPAEQADLVAYLEAVGDGEQGIEPDSIAAALKEIRDFSSVFEIAIPAHDKDVIALAANTLDGELRELTEHFPDRKDITVVGGRPERNAARMVLKGLVLSLRRIAVAAAAGDFEQATSAYRDYNASLGLVDKPLETAKPWSLFNAPVHDAHYATMRKVLEAVDRHLGQ